MHEHRTRRLQEVRATCGEGCTPRRLLDAALDHGLDVTLDDCCAALGMRNALPECPSMGLRDLVLHAAQLFDGVFSKSELVVAAYRLAPKLFCLDGYPEHPDSNRVWAYLYGARGLIAQGKVERVGNGFKAV